MQLSLHFVRRGRVPIPRAYENFLHEILARFLDLTVILSCFLDSIRTIPKKLSAQVSFRHTDRHVQNPDFLAGQLNHLSEIQMAQLNEFRDALVEKGFYTPFLREIPTGQPYDDAYLL